MKGSDSVNSKEVNSSSFDRWKVIWPAFIIVACSFLLVILVVLGVDVDKFMIR